MAGIQSRDDSKILEKRVGLNSPAVILQTKKLFVAINFREFGDILVIKIAKFNIRQNSLFYAVLACDFAQATIRMRCLLM